MEADWAIAVHGGAGDLGVDDKPQWWTPAYCRVHKEAINEALYSGKKILESGGSAIDAVCAAVVVLENCEWFNAGKGAVYTEDHFIELDATIMDGRTGRFGSVACATDCQNPILLAKAMLDGPEIIVAREGATTVAKRHGLKIVSPDYFSCRLNEMLYARNKNLNYDTSWHKEFEQEPKECPDSTGETVGAVALDLSGTLAAGTSTGGKNGQIMGRIGDSAMIGAGTFATKRCAISCTGDGEGFIRYLVAKEIDDRMRFSDLLLDEALEQVIADELVLNGVKGGAIGIDNEGRVSILFNTDSMFRGLLNSEGWHEVGLGKVMHAK